jgi:hypothetical protein
VAVWIPFLAQNRACWAHPPQVINGDQDLLLRAWHDIFCGQRIQKLFMSINIQMREGVIEAVFHGEVTGNDLRQLLETLHDLESRLEVTPDRISDLSDGGVEELRSADLVAFAESRGVAKLKNKVKSAIIAPGSTQYGLARMFSANNENPAIDIKIFKDSASAYNWIGLKAKSVDKPSA